MMIPAVKNRRTHGLSNVPSEATLPIERYGLAVPITIEDERGKLIEMLEKCYDCGVESDCVLEPREVKSFEDARPGYGEAVWTKLPVCDSRRACRRNRAAKQEDDEKAKQAAVNRIYDGDLPFAGPLAYWIEKGWATKQVLIFPDPPAGISFEDALLQGYARLTAAGIDVVKGAS